MLLFYYSFVPLLDHHFVYFQEVNWWTFSSRLNLFWGWKGPHLLLYPSLLMSISRNSFYFRCEFQGICRNLHFWVDSHWFWKHIFLYRPFVESDTFRFIVIYKDSILRRNPMLHLSICVAILRMTIYIWITKSSAQKRHDKFYLILTVEGSSYWGI